MASRVRRFEKTRPMKTLSSFIGKRRAQSNRCSWPAPSSSGSGRGPYPVEAECAERIGLHLKGRGLRGSKPCRIAQVEQLSAHRAHGWRRRHEQGVTPYADGLQIAAERSPRRIE